MVDLLLFSRLLFKQSVNVWVKKTETNLSSDTLLWFVSVFLTQTLYWHFLYHFDLNQKGWYARNNWRKTVRKIIDRLKKLTYESQFCVNILIDCYLYTYPYSGILWLWCWIWSPLWRKCWFLFIKEIIKDWIVLSLKFFK